MQKTFSSPFTFSESGYHKKEKKNPDGPMFWTVRRCFPARRNSPSSVLPSDHRGDSCSSTPAAANPTVASSVSASLALASLSL